MGCSHSHTRRTHYILQLCKYSINLSEATHAEPTIWHPRSKDSENRLGACLSSLSRERTSNEGKLITNLLSLPCKAPVSLHWELICRVYHANHLSVFVCLSTFLQLSVACLLTISVACPVLWGGGGGGGGEGGCLDRLMCCHTETAVTSRTCHLNESQYTDTGPMGATTDCTRPGMAQGGQRSWSLGQPLEQASGDGHLTTRGMGSTTDCTRPGMRQCGQ